MPSFEHIVLSESTDSPDKARLLGIRERADKLQGALTIESTPGAGTHIRVVVPAGSAVENGNL